MKALKGIDPGAWASVTLGTNITGAASYATPAVRRDAETDVLRLRGRLSAGAAIAANATVFTLPVGSRPTFQQAVAARASTGAISLQIAATTGVVTISTGIASAATVDLDGLTFCL